MRNVVVHYHLFKNAGSTVDHILEKAFGDRWVTYDKDEPTGRINADELVEYLDANPAVDALSSHHTTLPLPQVDRLSITPIVFFRHPLDRVRSVYDFERRQGLEQGPVSMGADHASRLSFADYLRWRLDTTINGVVHNQQTVWMIYDRRFNRHAITDADFERASSIAMALPFFGIVERFDESIRMLTTLLAEQGVELDTSYQAQNISQRVGATLDDRLAVMRETIGDAMWEELVSRNARDLALYELAVDEFDKRVQQSVPRVRRTVG